jgi:hypothetical protein
MPFVRLGGKLTTSAAPSAVNLGALLQSPVHLITHSSARLLAQLGVLAGQALLAWLLLAIPVVMLLTATLTHVLRRVPAMAAAEAGD